MANAYLYKGHAMHSTLALAVSDMLRYEMFFLENVGQSRGV